MKNYSSIRIVARKTLSAHTHIYFTRYTRFKCNDTQSGWIGILNIKSENDLIDEIQITTNNLFAPQS